MAAKPKKSAKPKKPVKKKETFNKPTREQLYKQMDHETAEMEKSSAERLKKMQETEKFGRPTIYSDELGERICELVSVSTKSIEKLCIIHKDLPDPTTIYKWRISNKDFSQKYNDARANQADLLAMEIIDIADDSSHDTLIKEDQYGNLTESCNSEWIARSRLRVDARKWIASRLLPKIYGDRVQYDTNLTVKNQEDVLKELE